MTRSEIPYIPIELLAIAKPDGTNLPKFWFGQQIFCRPLDYWGLIFGIAWKPEKNGWNYWVRFEKDCNVVDDFVQETFLSNG